VSETPEEPDDIDESSLSAYRAENFISLIEIRPEGERIGGDH
jgi:hypothetical protein